MLSIYILIPASVTFDMLGVSDVKSKLAEIIRGMKKKENVMSREAGGGGGTMTEQHVAKQANK